VLLEKGCGLAGNQVGSRHDLHVRLVEISLDMGAGDPAGPDKADAQLPAGIDRLDFLVLLERIQYRLFILHVWFLLIFAGNSISCRCLRTCKPNPIKR
jgi:hypothetical protein